MLPAEAPREEKQISRLHQLTLWTPGKTSKNPGLWVSIWADSHDLGLVALFLWASTFPQHYQMELVTISTSQPHLPSLRIKDIECETLSQCLAHTTGSINVILFWPTSWACLSKADGYVGSHLSSEYVLELFQSLWTAHIAGWLR